MKRYFFLAFSAWIVVAAASCKSAGGGSKNDSSELAAADDTAGFSAADLAAYNKILTPISEAPGYDDSCVGCLQYWITAEDPNKVNNPQADWAALQGKCRSKGQCQAFDYVNAWSPFVLIDKVRKGPNARWATWRKENKKIVCVYSDPYFTGQEVCYAGPGRALLPDSVKGKVSAYHLENLNLVRAKGNGINRYIDFHKGDGYNLLPEFNDKLTEIFIPN